jgi:hypothetical protein
MHVPGGLRMALRRLPLYKMIRDRRQQKELEEWIKSGKKAPPPHFAKVNELRAYSNQFHPRVLVETGTYLGDTIEAVKDLFDRVYSIELDATIHRNARKRFAKDRKVTLLHGDSGEVLPGLLTQIDQPCLFWLDGHFSGDFTAKGSLDTPIMAELRYIGEHPLKEKHVILIDDARCFNGTHDYPTVEAVRDWAKAEGYEHFEARDDILRIHN